MNKSLEHGLGFWSILSVLIEAIIDAGRFVFPGVPISKNIPSPTLSHPLPELTVLPICSGTDLLEARKAAEDCYSQGSCGTARCYPKSERNSCWRIHVASTERFSNSGSSC